MKLSQLHIQNFRSCRNTRLEIGNMHALVGANNAGKSTILRALDFLFNPSTKNLDQESFWNKDISLEIRVEAVFTDLTEAEKTSLSGCLNSDDTFHMARSARFESKDLDAGADEEESKIKISQHYKQPVPKLDWLQEGKISGKNITEWWKNKDQLAVEGTSFSALWTDGKKPGVEDWKEKAKQFIAANASQIPMEDAWIDNPKGYANVLKATLPFFILVPAVRDVTEESKGTKTSPFGKLMIAILGAVAADKKAKIDRILTEVSKQMNRFGGAKRVPLISDTESRLNSLLNDFFTGCDLEIEFQTPTLETLLSTPKLFVDDGFRNSIENKGHGLQRAVIFTILRRYAEFVTSAADGKRRSLILGVEEPELYMHPQAQRTIRRVFRTIAEGGDQVVFTTHSSLLVDVAYFDEIIRVENCITNIDGKKTTWSEVWQLPMSKMIADIETRIPKLKGKVTTESMRDLYSHAYNPRRNEGFFASKIILAEGLTEEYSLPIYADVISECAFDPQNISVVECGGKGAMDRLYRVFNELHIPCYLLFDYDLGNTDRAIIDKSKELLKLAGQPVTDPAALVVTDEVACFKQTWEKDLRGEITNIEDLTKKARIELGINSDSGKPLVARFVARKLTAQKPPFVPPSVEKIIKQAVSVKWKKSCLATLAPSIPDAAPKAAGAEATN